MAQQVFSFGAAEFATLSQLGRGRQYSAPRFMIRYGINSQAGGAGGQCKTGHVGRFLVPCRGLCRECLCLAGLRLPQRNLDTETAADADFATHFEFAVVFLDDAVGQ